MNYSQINLLVVGDTSVLQFLPQEMAFFYEVAGLTYKSYLEFTIIFNIRGGYNKPNKETGKLTVFRWGFPLEVRRIKLVPSLENIQAILADIKGESSLKRTIYIKLKKRIKIPLTLVRRPIPLS